MSAPPLTRGQKKQAVTYLLQIIGVFLVANVPTDSPIRSHFEVHKGKLIRQLDHNQHKLICQMRDTVQHLAELLVKCQNVEQLYQAMAYIESLNEGEVWIVEDQEKPEGFVTTQERMKELETTENSEGRV